MPSNARTGPTLPGIDRWLTAADDRGLSRWRAGLLRDLPRRDASDLTQRKKVGMKKEAYRAVALTRVQARAPPLSAHDLLGAPTAAPTE
ncbi:hypothetical protein GCM10020218_082350 [Dactylosporangium vinaceum]